MLNRIVRSTKRWINNNSDNALEEAYQRALMIKNMENEHFKGNKISFKNCDYGESVWTYFQSELESHLNIIKLKIGQFKTNNSIRNFIGNQDKLKSYNNEHSDYSSLNYEQSIILEKLNFIDEIINKYNGVYHEVQVSGMSSPQNKNTGNNHNKGREENDLEKTETVTDKTSVLPRSFLKTLDRIKQEIDPQSSETEKNVVNKFRKSRYKTAVSVKFLLLLIIVPLLVHNFSKITLGKIFVDPYFQNHGEIIFINQDLQEEALTELRNFEENLELKMKIGILSELTAEEKENKIREKALELTENYRGQSANAIKNIFADIFSFIAFGIVIFYSKKELSILKSFIDEAIYGLSDSAKAFLIILFTDMFVGFHSPHGWEVILEGIGRHFGLPENRDFNFLFIATFPVILDTVLKYWIFRYLNRISPSAVATYKNMNES